jgi:phage terminase large subunit-like protein
LIDYGQKIADGVIDDPAFVSHCHSVPMDAPMLDENSWVKANPGLGDYRDLEEMRAAVKRAVKMPSQEATVRVYYFNQRVQSSAPYLTKSVYARGDAVIDPKLFWNGRPVYGGLDLSARNDLTALVWAVEDDDGIVHLWPKAWTPAETLADRTTRDRAPLDVWVSRGLLAAVPGTTIDYDWVAHQVGLDTAAMNVVRINYDRWRIDILRQALARADVGVELAPMGQGYKDMSPAVEAFEELALAGRLRHGGHPVMRWCFSNAVIRTDEAGNRKLDKSRAYGRIDVAVAAVMAVAAMKTAATPATEIAAMIA